MKNSVGQRGFTLVEIAIVMVIIGLLLGGALKGQQMIESAKIKSLKRFHDEVKAAWFSYQDIYRYFPGDDPNASTNLGDSSIANGNGNGTVEGNWRSKSDKTEAVLVWKHLTASGLLGVYKTSDSSTWAGTAGVHQTLPENVFGGATGFEYTVGEQLNTPVLCFNGLHADIAMKIDAAYDDGEPESGTVVATDMTITQIRDSYDINLSALCFKF